METACIFDMDSTLTIITGRSPYDDGEKCLKDIPNEHVVKVLKLYWNSGHRIIICSGRDQGRSEQYTRLWLEKHNIPYDFLYMRKSQDIRPDDIIKNEIYEEYIKTKFDIIGVYDDRLRVCKLWHRLGLPLFRVGDPEANY